MKPTTKEFVDWIQTQQQTLKPRNSRSRGTQYVCYSMDIDIDNHDSVYSAVPEFLHSYISDMEGEEIKSKEFWVPGSGSYMAGIGQLITDDWVEYKLKWKYKAKP